MKRANLCVFLIVLAVMFIPTLLGAQAAAKPVVVSIWGGQLGVRYDGKTSFNWSSTPAGKALSERWGVDWQFTFTNAADVETAFNLRLAASDWPEVIGMPYGRDWTWLSKLLAAKVVGNIDRYYNNAKYPNIKLMRPDVIEYWRYSDGKIYNFPKDVYESPTQPWGYWAAAVLSVHPDYLKAVNMKKEDLKTLEGVEKYLYAVKAANLKTADGLPVLPITSGENVGMWRVWLPVFGVSWRGMGFDSYDGEYIHYRDAPGTKAAMQWLNKLWRDGVMDPEALSQKNDILAQKLTTRRVALLGNQAWDYWGAATAYPNPATEMIFIDFPKVAGVKRLGISTTYNPMGSGGLMLTNRLKNPDAVAKFVDYLYAGFDPNVGSERGWEGYLGPRGMFWDYDPFKGKPYYVLKGEYKEGVEAGDSTIAQRLGIGYCPMGVMGTDINWFSGSNESLTWIMNMHKFYYNKPNVSAMKPWMDIKMPTDGAWYKGSQVAGQLDTQYFAKLVSAESPSAFDSIWAEWRDQLEKQASWSKMKAEYLQQVKVQVK